MVDLLKLDRDPYTLVIACIRALGRLGNGAMTSHIASFLTSNSAMLKTEAVNALACLAPYNYASEFARLLQDQTETGTLRSACLSGLAETLHLRQLVPLLLEALSDSNARVRVTARGIVRRLQLRGVVDKTEDLVEFIIGQLDLIWWHLHITESLTIEECQSLSEISSLVTGYMPKLTDRELATVADRLDEFDNAQVCLGLIGRQYPAIATKIALLALDGASALQGARFLVEQRSTEAVDFLTRIASEGTPRERVEALELLARSSAPELLDTLCAAVWDDSLDLEVRCDAIAALCRIANSRAEHTLVEALSSPNERIRNTAAKSLGEVKTASAAKALLSALDLPGDRTWIDNVVIALGKTGQCWVSSVLVTRYNKLRAQTSFVTRCLAELAWEDAIQVFLDELVRDEAFYYVDEAIRGLARLKKPSVISKLRRLIENGNAPYASLSVLTDMNTREATEVISVFLKHSDVDIRRTAARCLGQREWQACYDGGSIVFKSTTGSAYSDRVFEQEIVNRLISALCTEVDEENQRVIIDALGGIGNPSASEPILNVLRKTRGELSH